jgi:hypothetical protein
MSTSISQRMATEIKEEVSRLLGRGRSAFDCPLNAEERAKLWHDSMDQNVVGAINLLEAKGYNVGFHKAVWCQFQTNLEGESYTISLWNSAHDDPSFLQLGDMSQYRGPGLLVHAFPQPAERWLEFVQWVQNTGRIERDFAAAQDTLESVLDFCNTIGQLTRAVPELAQYLSTEKREILQGQKRASNMPYEWATFDRKRIDVLQFSMAKAHLFPQGHNFTWGRINKSHAVLSENPC